jgi:hypothetical protein
MVMQAPALVLLTLAALAPLAVALASTTAPRPSGPVAAVFPPWWDNRRAVLAAASSTGAVIRGGAFSFVVIVSTTDRALLRSRGAWLLLDPGAVGGCAPSAH